jgi:hypothetical protein
MMRAPGPGTDRMRTRVAQFAYMVYIYRMPYADEAQQRQAQRAWWKAEYDNSPQFRRKELKRKKAARASWSSKRKAHNREYMREFMREYRAKLKKEAAAKAKTATRTTAKKATRAKAATARAPKKAAAKRTAARRR